MYRADDIRGRPNANCTAASNRFTLSYGISVFCLFAVVNDRSSYEHGSIEALKKVHTAKIDLRTVI